jgi:hypothetical protein
MPPCGSLAERGAGRNPESQGYGGSAFVKKRMKPDADDRKLLASVSIWSRLVGWC